VANHQWSGDKIRRAINVAEVQRLFVSTSTGHLAIVDFPASVCVGATARGTLT
jgi:hypothetical protein